MPQAFTAGNWSVSVKPIDLISAALQEISVIDPNEPLSARDAAWGLEKLQRIIDQWNAKREMIYAISFSLFNLIANHSPHTIGPLGDFNIPQRPVRMESASFILNPNSNNPIDAPLIRIRDADWWAANPLKQLSTSIVTDLYYSPNIPLGQCFFYPICNIANPVRLEYWTGISQAINLATGLALPTAYWDALVLSLAKSLAPSFEKSLSAEFRDNYYEAMKAVLDNNDAPPRIDTNSGGMPGSASTGRPDFDFLTGMRE
jgi:hypothetical protein